jgi:hypothetical protein
MQPLRIRKSGHGGRSALSSFPVLACVTGCAPTVNVAGTYFPPSLVSAAIGVIVAYVAVWLLARSPKLLPLAQSALFFSGVAVILGFAAWWSLFRGF